MARNLFNAELGLGIFAENGDLLVNLISGTAVPDGTSGEQGSSPIGSIYLRSGTGELYQKIANAGAPADWELNGTSNAVIGKWRGERIRAVTNDTVSVGARDLTASPFADDDTPLLTAADFVVGDFIIADADGTPSLLEVTAVSAPNVTFAAAADPLVAEDTFVAINYLPDTPGGQEGRAIVNYNGSVIVKLADIDWNFADGINMAAGYTAQNGTISSSDTVNSAIEKLDGNQQDIQSTLGVAQGDVDLGTSSANGNVVQDNATVKEAIDQLDVAASGTPQTETGVSSATVLDAVLVDDFRSAVWLVTVFDEANPADVKSAIVHGANNGTSSADATGVDDNVSSILQSGVFNSQIDIVLNGTGTSQEMRLQVNTTEPGVTFTAVRMGAAPSGY